MSGLYFRGKLEYSLFFSRPPAGVAGSLIITPGRGLIGPDELITRNQLIELAAVDVDERNPRYREPLEQAARSLAANLPGDCEAVLLGSVATSKYTGVLSKAFGARLKFPVDFVGRGDMSRGGLLLRCVESREELRYIEVAGAVRHGPRPPKLTRRTSR